MYIKVKQRLSIYVNQYNLKLTKRDLITTVGETINDIELVIL